VLDPYYVLGVSLNATPEEIRAAYRRRAAESHPDRHPPEKRAWASEQMKQLNAARDLLLDPVRRARHDEKMRLEMQKAMWRAKRDAYAPPPPAETRVRRRSRAGWLTSWLFILGLLLLIPWLLSLSALPLDAANPLTWIVGLARCVGGMFVFILLAAGVTYFLYSLTQALKR
jgi:hypothetical protein